MAAPPPYDAAVAAKGTVPMTSPVAYTPGSFNAGAGSQGVGHGKGSGRAPPPSFTPYGSSPYSNVPSAPPAPIPEPPAGNHSGPAVATYSGGQYSHAYGASNTTTTNERMRRREGGFEICPLTLSMDFLSEQIRPYDPPRSGWENGTFHTPARICGWPICGCGSAPRACIAIGAFPVGVLFALGWVTFSYGAGIGQACFGLLMAVGQVAVAPLGWAIGQLALGVIAGLGQLATGVFVGGMVRLGRYDLLKLLSDGKVETVTIA
ncbi:uncharacterized protein AMSG_10709 [Thecamonas trahens ATCC 50062]|uniref:Uncharacterized protein n=1 Tax=Thecamonas trahens ATCC 50062 TaxID=461836 RepID=A0A0L0DS66_THETB|nr:hypothetical protein AMSG_10709 [Thecamonas trahens ATCC 50062]KNC55110.1 hypothetical protein AMSG_10709 [Thecamonas trahens ATCC 50062]|eukprot:XP_013753293.1 hypothetical protein AMSG_10709 [Thecamonas trahens ATCC 50062]